MANNKRRLEKRKAPGAQVGGGAAAEAASVAGGYSSGSFPQVNDPSQNYGSRKGTEVDTVMIHYTGSENPDSGKSWLKNPESKVSAHLVIDQDGKRTKMVDYDKRAWHAGTGDKAGPDMNNRSIGIELTGTGKNFPKAQMESLVEASKELKKEFPAIAQRPFEAAFVGHNQWAPSRRGDPGPRFNWEWYQKQLGPGGEKTPYPGGDSPKTNTDGKPKDKGPDGKTEKPSKVEKAETSNKSDSEKNLPYNEKGDDPEAQTFNRETTTRQYIKSASRVEPPSLGDSEPSVMADIIIPAIANAATEILLPATLDYTVGTNVGALSQIWRENT